MLERDGRWLEFGVPESLRKGLQTDIDCMSGPGQDQHVKRIFEGVVFSPGDPQLCN